MKVAFVGCGYVFDIYMRTKWAYPEIEIAGVYDIDRDRSKVVESFYKISGYESYKDLLSDESIDIVINLTSIRSHFAITKQALEAGKHVYSEKPLAASIEELEILYSLAQKMNVVFSGAPCNIYSDSIATVWKAIKDGAIGRPVLVYAELDDNPAHLMNLQNVRSPTGAPFPYREELQEGCTIEHVGYHLAWIFALFGPAVSVTAFSKNLIENKVGESLDPPDTPDFSVACISFANGEAARITCTWVSPRDHRFRVIGDAGEIRADNVFHDQSSIHLERFSHVSLTARKFYTIRNQPSNRQFI